MARTILEPITIANAPTLSLCVVNYNGARYLPDTLPAVRTIRNQFEEVLLVDNGSTDDSVENRDPNSIASPAYLASRATK